MSSASFSSSVNSVSSVSFVNYVVFKFCNFHRTSMGNANMLCNHHISDSALSIEKECGSQITGTRQLLLIKLGQDTRLCRTPLDNFFVNFCQYLTTLDLFGPI